MTIPLIKVIFFDLNVFFPGSTVTKKTPLMRGSYYTKGYLFVRLFTVFFSFVPYLDLIVF